mgnify:CR=1 FL=1
MLLNQSFKNVSFVVNLRIGVVPITHFPFHAQKMGAALAYAALSMG